MGGIVHIKFALSFREANSICYVLPMKPILLKLLVLLAALVQVISPIFSSLDDQSNSVDSDPKNNTSRICICGLGSDHHACVGVWRVSTPQIEQE
jgi:hypothetical protein